ncbi:hypothetical protein PMAYCL1PPCAC_08671, partial [Pristionchus mayeri]
VLVRRLVECLMKGSNIEDPVIQKTIGILNDLINNGWDAQKLDMTSRSLERELCAAELRDAIGTDKPLLNLICDLSKCLESGVRWMLDRDIKRHGKHESKESELWAVSDLEEESSQGGLVKIENRIDQFDNVTLDAISNDSSPENYLEDVESDNSSEEVTDSDSERDTSPLKCEECGKKFLNRQTLRMRKKRLHQAVVELPFECKDCGKKFPFKDYLTSHEISHLPLDHPRRKQYECIQCGNRYRSYQALDYHKRKHMKDAEGNTVATTDYKCDVCDKFLSCLSSLLKHKRGHLDDDDPRKRKYECKICGKKYKGPSGLNNHMPIHIPDEKTRLPLKCDVCGKRFREQRHLSAHSWTHLPEDDPRKAKPFECKQCDKKFRTKLNLISHERTHINDREKPHKCDVCGKNFLHELSLKTHMRMHGSTEEERRPYACNICG